MHHNIGFSCQICILTKHNPDLLEFPVRMSFRRHFLPALLLLLPAVFAHAATTVENIRVWSENGRTLVVLDLSLHNPVLVEQYFNEEEPEPESGVLKL